MMLRWSIHYPVSIITTLPRLAAHSLTIQHSSTTTTLMAVVMIIVVVVSNYHPTTPHPPPSPPPSVLCNYFALRLAPRSR
mmetsp:Transcript_21344/g.32995  ORF Transcript_21344/g.32995 Transcript_21344/m.32995 type:complete len:80 (+) Transcript_21344:563-802(+)